MLDKKGRKEQVQTQENLKMVVVEVEGIFTGHWRFS